MLSAGDTQSRLFATSQVDSTGGGKFTIEWIQLGAGKSEELMLLVDDLTFADIFELGSADNNTW
jgi:hypothetical protein